MSDITKCSYEISIAVDHYWSSGIGLNCNDIFGPPDHFCLKILDPFEIFHPPLKSYQHHLHII